ncbi:MAG: pilus assembly protein [Pseudomonadota bacterium]|nr:pilus assembly protein [Pseudomonadota bacterium]
MRQFERPTPALALPAKLVRRAKEFCRARQAIAAVEFALLLPLLIMLMLGSVEVARLIISARNVTAVATTAVEMLSQNGTKKVNYVDLHFATDSTMVIFPQILQDAAQKGISWKNDISVSIAGVLFSGNPPGCTSSCTSYTANVVWNSGPNKRTCGVPLTSAPDTAAPSTTTLPADVFPVAPSSGASLLVVDIVYNYTPIFASTFTALFGHPLFGTIPIARSAYLAPRYIQFPPNYIKYDGTVSGDDGIGKECPQYPFP